MADIPTKSNNKSFVRWQGRSIEAIGKAINLLLTLSLATLGFVVSKLLNEDFYFQFCFSKILVACGLFILIVCCIVLLRLMFNRLLSFKITTQIARKREKNDNNNIAELRSEGKRRDMRTWKLFKVSICLFGSGEMILLIALIFELIFRYK